MGFRNLAIEPEYRTMQVDIANELIIPLLEHAVSYKRAVGFFSSSSLLEISKGIGALAKKGGRIQLVASPNLSEKDIEAISSGYEQREAVIQRALVSSLPDMDDLDKDGRDRFNLLANLIAKGILDIRIALIDKNNSIGIYHEKVALMEDGDGDKVAFSGSMNESKMAMVENYETVDVFCSWEDPQLRVIRKESYFDAIWSGDEDGIATYEFDSIKETIKEKYLVSEPDYDLDVSRNESHKSNANDPVDYELHPFGIPRAPEESAKFKELDYQTEAVANWVNNGFRGLFDMATGTGKTITSLLAVVKAYEAHNGKLTVLITCPYQHLVEQWLSDLDLFGIKPIVAYGASSQKDWKKRLKDAITDRRLGLQSSDFICCISTNATLAGKWMQSVLSKLRGSVLLVADEAHNLGAPGYQKVLWDSFDCRLALSATISRHHDEEGTQLLLDYFGEACIHYPIERAIRAGRLCEYIYYPVPCYLSDSELDTYHKLTKELGSSMVSDGHGGSRLSKSGEIIAQKRARLVAGASSKLELLKEQIQPYVNKNHILVYCGAAQVLDDDEDFTSVSDQDRRQITYVVDLLGNKLGMRVSKFTSEEDIEEREALKEDFKNGEQLQALVAIKCLDEGVNIPNICTAFMLASTTNPKEYIQRRGRLLRLAPGKDHAEIFDFITLPYPTDYAAGQTIDELSRVYRLVANEIDRGMEFAEHARNFSDAQETLDEISEAFRLDQIRFMKKEGV